MPDTLVVAQSKHSKNPKKKRGRPKKSRLSAVDKIAEPSEKKKKSSSIKKAHNSSDEVDMNISAVVLAAQLGFEKPHEKITIKSSGNDRDEDITKQASPVEIIQQLIDYKKLCKCSCLADLNIQDIASHRMEITLLDRHSRDFFIMGLLRCGAVTFKDAANHNSRNRYSYRLMNTRICQCCFLAVNNIGGKYLKNLKKHFAEHGVTSRLHGNHGRKPHHAISNSGITDVVEFVNRYASIHGVPAARRPKNPRAEHIMRLPPSDNVTSIHKKYKEFCESSGQRAVALTSFRKIWSHHLAHIKLTFKDYSAAVKNLAPSISVQDPALNIDSNLQHSLLRQVSQIQGDSQDTNTVTQSLELQTAVSQKSPVSLPYEYGGAELPHNQMIPLNMYMADGSNHDTLHYGYIFSQTSVPLAHHIQTVTINNTSPTNDDTSMKTEVQTSLSNNQHPSFPAAVSSPVRHVLPADTFNLATDKQVLLFSPNSALDSNSGHLHMAHFSPTNPTVVFNHTSLTSPAGPDIHQEAPGLVGSGLTTLTEHIQMSLFQ